MNQHYISRFILQNFSDDGVRIWTCARGDTPNKQKIERVFRGSHITSLKTIDTSNRASKSFNLKTFEQSIRKNKEIYEQNIIGRLESETAPIIKSILNRAPHMQFPDLSSEETNAVKQFLLLSARRTPESQAAMRTTNNPDRAFDLFKQKADEEHIPFGEKDEMYHLFPPIKRINDIVLENTDASFAAGVIPKIRLATENICREVGIAVTYSTRRRFIIGSYGYAIVTRCLETGYDKVAYFSVSPSVAISLTRRPDRAYVYFATATEVRQVNIATAEMSHTIAGSTNEDLLKYQRFIT